ncbi:MAG TPA: hypothetical protein VLI72_09925 [Methylibium sp.]|nr:hypothetical protein [Methylibium sp.]
MRPPSIVVAVALAAGLPAHAAQQIVRQRLPDGSIVFTDRPQPGGTIEQRWQFEPEDPVAAQARRDALQRESDAVSERLNRREADARERALQAELARARADQAAAESEAARARAEEPRHIAWPILRAPLPKPPASMGVTPPPPRERAIDRLIPPRRPATADEQGR